MFVARVSFPIIIEAEDEAQSDLVYIFYGSWRMNGQVLGQTFPMAKTDIDISIFVNVPSVDALSKKYDNKYVQEDYAMLEKVGLRTPSIMIVGKEPECIELCRCERTSFILYANYLSVESPLRCRGCFGVVPLYDIPKTKDHEYHDVIVWQSDYQACDSLQMNCQVGEEWSTKQLSTVDSELSLQGLKVCQRIEEVTGKKVYYYLYHDKGESLEKEKQRVCPKCEKKWHIKEQLHHLFDFKCDDCGFLSNVAWDV